MEPMLSLKDKTTDKDKQFNTLVFLRWNYTFKLPAKY